MHHSYLIKRSRDESQEHFGTEDYDDLTIHEKIFSKGKQPKPKVNKFHNPKKTRAQELKERKTQDLLTERKLKEQQQQLEIEIRQEKIRIEQQRIRPTLRRIRSTMSSMNALTKRDQIKSVEKRYKEWLLLKDQEHHLRQTMLAKLSGDFTTFSIEKALNIVREQERLEAEKEEVSQEQSQEQPSVELRSREQSQEMLV